MRHWRSEHFEKHIDFDQEYIDAWVTRLKELRAEGKVLFHVTCTYLDPAEFPLTAKSANRYLRKFYFKLIQHLRGNKRFHEQRFRNTQPQLYAFLDVPGSKPKHYQTGHAPGKDSRYHHHCILVVDQAHADKIRRMIDPVVATAFADRTRLTTKLKTLHVQEVGETDTDIASVVGYATYWSRKHLYQDAAMQVYPAAASES